MELYSRSINKIIIIDIVGEIDIYNSNNLKELILKKIENGENKIVINLERVSYIDSSGIGTLISCNSILTQRKGGLILENINESIKRIFKLTQLDSILNIASNEEDAINFFNKIN